ncbi:MAG: Flp pilus assembly protein CpaB [Candidatus Acidiferrales bacterium]
MDRRRILMALGAALPLALLAAFLVHHELSKATARRAIPSIQVVIAAEDLPPGTLLGAENLRQVDWPAAQAMEGMRTRLEDCQGRAVLNAVVENEPILEANLAAKDSGAGLPAIIPQGMRAVSVAVNDVIGVAGFVQPGTAVDVIATGTPAGGGSTTVARTVLEDIHVLAAGQKVEPDTQGAPQSVSVVTLLVRPEQAAVLALASVQGRIQLALRNVSDTVMVNPPAADEAAVFGTVLREAAPAENFHARETARRVEPESSGVEVFRGTKEEISEAPQK